MKKHQWFMCAIWLGLVCPAVAQKNSEKARDGTPNSRRLAAPVEAAVQASSPSADLGAPPPAALPEVYDIQAKDSHLRGVIQRWASESGWVFEAQHWTLPRDIPVAGRAVFERNDFRMAMRWLMRSTLQTDLPAQACFYSNHVVRIISLQESCLRNINQE
ncbi:MAG: TcpQ domain-containing protein [Alphaproteobacteria bacterium]|nr:TcpQ domain-containing protein [Alphaproteobacteria bacterium]